MSSVRLNFAGIRIPFRMPFSHASATRVETENVIVIARDSDGRAGLGEGCPRFYVTHESITSTLAFLAHKRAGLEADVHDVHSLSTWILANNSENDQNPSALCAVELALLDLFAQQEGVCVETLLGLPPSHASPTATAVYGAQSNAAFLLQALRFRMNGMREAKLKLTGNARRDYTRERLLASYGPLRLDANNLWADASAAVRALMPLVPHCWAIEEPVQPRDWPGLARTGAETGLTIILDESFTTAGDLRHLQAGARYIVNLRVSKLGGLLRSLAAMRHCRENGLQMIVGAHVGETSILARAGVLLANAAAEDLMGFEAGYGLHLLKRDLTTPSVSFGRGGRVTIDTEKSGFGLTPTAETLTALAADI